MSGKTEASRKHDDPEVPPKGSRDEVAHSPETNNGLAQVGRPQLPGDTFKLNNERKALEDKLPADKKEKLQEYRMAMSRTDSPTKQAKYKRLIDDLDPNLAKVNAKIARRADEMTSLTKPLSHIGKPFAAAQKLLPTIALIGSGLEHTGESLTRQLEKQQTNWYAPYREVYQFARRNGLSVEFNRDGNKVSVRWSASFRSCGSSASLI